MAHYLIDTGSDPNLVLRVEADSIRQAIDSLNLEDGESVTVYRIVAEPKKVTAKTETVRRFEIVAG